MRTINVGRLNFPTKAAAKEFFRAIRDQYQDFERLAPGDALLLSELLSIHPEADQKIGVGISGFHVERDREWGKTRGFFVDRIDGTSTDFSFLTCIDGKNPRNEVHQALRTAVKEQIVEFKRCALLAECVCPVTGVRLGAKNSHVDHQPPKTFAWLVQNWMSDAILDYESLVLVPSADNQFACRLADAGLRDCWAEYHRENAVLRLVSARANLSDIRRGAGVDPQVPLSDASQTHPNVSKQEKNK